MVVQMAGQLFFLGTTSRLGSSGTARLQTSMDDETYSKAALRASKKLKPFTTVTATPVTMRDVRRMLA